MADIKKLPEAVEQESHRLTTQFRRYFWVSIGLMVLLLIIIAFIYTWEYPIFDWNYSIDASRWGQYGDFFGGVIGTIITFISIYFLFQAFKEQRLANLASREANENIKETEGQHIYSEYVTLFANDFKTLLELYKDAQNAFKTTVNDNGKVALSSLISDFIQRTDFDCTKEYTKSAIEASKLFETFMSTYRTQINTQMRILYQMLQMLENNVDEYNVVPYAKMLRSQFSDEDLLLVRYNCLSQMGVKMQNPVFHFNMLKHLPLLNLLEFSNLRKKLEQNEKGLINEELIILRKQICTMFRRDSETDKHSIIEFGKFYKIESSVSSDNRSYTCEFKIKQHDNKQKLEQVETALDKFNKDEIEQLLSFFHSELFKISHFKQYNRQKEFTMNVTHTDKNGVYSVKVKAENICPIIVSYLQMNDPMPINIVGERDTENNDTKKSVILKIDFSKSYPWLTVSRLPNDKMNNSFRQ